MEKRNKHGKIYSGDRGILCPDKLGSRPVGQQMVVTIHCFRGIESAPVIIYRMVPDGGHT